LTTLYGAKTTDYSLGGPLSPTEVEDLAARAVLQDEADDVVTLVTDRPDEFGGIYFDQSRGGLDVTIQVLGTTPPDLIERARQMVPSGMGIEVQTVEHSWADLEAATTASLDSAGVVMAAPDVKHNRIDVELKPGMRFGATKVHGVTAKVHHGRGLETAACASDTTCTPYRGGIEIVVGGNELCTWGFYGTRGTATKFVVTAGHCGTLGASAKHNGILVTTSTGIKTNTYDNASYADSDAAIAPVAGSTKAVTPFNTVYVSPTNTARPITATRSTANQQVGDTVCFAGTVSGGKCGTIQQTGMTAILDRDADGKRLTTHKLIKTTRSGTGGDSGGPVYYLNTAYGLITAIDTSDGNKVVYNAIREAEFDAAFDTCTTAAC
jgi:streptogrisin C